MSSFVVLENSLESQFRKHPQHNQSFLKFFVANHYVFSADGKNDNPDAPTIEALVKIHGKRKFVMHFTNQDVKWKKPTSW